MKITLYNVISEDGFVAAKDRKEDFIPNELWDSFISICNQNDVLVWGKNTYDAFMLYDEDLIKKFFNLPIKKIILSRDVDFVAALPFTVVHSIEEISSFGNNILVSGSAILNDLFVKEKLVTKLVVNVLPIMLHEGIPQFSVKPDMVLVSEKPFKGWVEKVYKLDNAKVYIE